MTTYYVSSIIGSDNNAGTSATDPLATLQDAANLVKPGDTVEVMNGTYTGPAGGVVVDITTSGTASAPITFEAAPGQTPVIDSSGTWHGIDIQASYIVVSGFTVVGNSASYTLQQALALNTPGTALLNGTGIQVDSPATGVVPNHIIIENNIVHNEPSAGISAINSDYVQILNNTVYNNANWSAYGASGISIWESQNSDTKAGVHDIISGNTVYNNAQLVPTQGGNIIYDGEGIILDTNPGFVGEILIQNNTVHGNGSSGIESFMTPNAVITGNTVYGNDLGNVQAQSVAEIFINQSNNNTVTNNITTAPGVPVPAAPVISSDSVNGLAVTLNGTAQANSTITVFDNSTQLGTTATNSSGAWTFASGQLTNGSQSQSFTATATDSAGTVSLLSSPLVVPLNVPVNLVANGNFATGDFTAWTLGGNDGSIAAGPQIFITPNATGGSANAAAVGSVGADGTLSQTIVTTPGQTYTLSFWLQNEGSGGNDFAANWNGQKLLSLTNASQFGYTEYTYTVTATGSTSTLQFSARNDPGQFDLDNVSLTASGTSSGGSSGNAPAAPTITSFSTDSGTAGDHITNDNTLTLSGTAAANSTVKVFDGTTQVATATADSSGAWTSTPTAALANGSHNLTATATNASGTSTASAALTVTIDTVAPNAPVETGASIVNGTHVQLTGTAEANSTLQVFDGTTQVGTATANSSGAWSLTTGTLASGGHSFTTKATDAAGNTSLASAALAVTIPSAPTTPAAPTIAKFSPDTGVVGDGITDANTLTLTGTAVANSTVKVFDGSAQIGTTTADSSGSWSYITSVLTDAIHVLKATDTVSGVTSAASSPLSVTVDTVAPAAPVLVSDSVVNTNHVLLSGTAEANSAITVYDGTTVVGATTTGANGTWSVTTSALASGTQALTTTATDVAGNVSAVSQPLDPVIPSAPPPTPPAAPQITSFSTDSGIVGDHITNDNTPMLTGTAVANSTVKVFDGTTQIGTTTANSSGQWHLTTPVLSDGTHDLTATDTDSSGQTSAPSSALSVTIDTVAPKAPIETSDSIVNTNQVQLNGTAEASSTLKVYDGATLVGTTTTDATGNWTVTTSPLSPGAHNLNATATDVAGNTSALSLPLDPIIGTTIESNGPTSLVQAGKDFYLVSVSSGTGPELQYKGAAVTVGEFGTFTPIGAVQVAGGGYDIAWKDTATGHFTAWSTDSNGNYLSNLFAPVSGTSTALESLETTFNQDLNGDGTIGIPKVVIQTDGSTSLTQVGNNYFLNPAAGGTGPELQYHGAAVTAGEFGTFTPIGAVQVAGGGYDIAWKDTATGLFTAWSTDSNGNYLSNLFAPVSGTSTALESLETTFNQDLNGDGTIGIPKVVIQTDGSTSLTQVGNNYFLNPVAGGTGPELQYHGAAVTAGEFGTFTPIGAVQVAGGGYDIAWKDTATGHFTAWSTDSNGNYLSNLFAPVSGTSTALESLETTFNQDLDGDGTIGIPKVVIQTDGSTSLTQVGNNYFLNPAAGGTGPELQYHGAAVTAGEFGTFTPIGAVQVAGGGYDIAWKDTATGLFTAWSTDSNGNYLSNLFAPVSGTSPVLESLETTFNQDLNGDGTIGVGVNFTSLTESASKIVTIQGTADAHSQVKLYDGTTSLGTATAAADGTWSFTASSAVTNTVHTFTAQEVDNTGHVVATSGNAILGSTGSNSLTSTTGNDLLVGNGQSDTFVFAPNFGKDVIQDFVAGGSGHDVIQFSKSVFDSFASVLSHASQTGQDVVISADASDSVTLKNTKLSALHSQDFHFA